MRSSKLVVGLVLAALAVGCGGGNGGGSGIGASTLSGPYGIFTFDGRILPTRGRSNLGRADADGVGMVSGVTSQNDDTTFTTGKTFDYGYTVDGAGNMNWQFGTFGTVLSGGITSDGAAAILSPSLPGANPGVQILLRRSGTYSDASLLGTFNTVMYAVNATPHATSSFGTTTFSAGSVVARLVEMSNVAGVVTTLTSWSIPGSYSVDSSGAVLANMSFDAAGQIFPGGDVVVMAGAIVSGQLPLITALMRRATTASLATFTGSYWVVSMRWTPGGFLSQFGTVTADGAGNGSISGQENDGAALAPFGPDAFTYTVAPDGVVHLIGGTTLYRGALSPDGRFVTLGGAETNGDAPTFYFLVRK